VLRIIVKTADFLSICAGRVASWLIVPLIAVTAIEVFARYLLKSPTIWAFEAGYMLGGSFFLLGGALALKDKAHIREDIFFRCFSRRLKALVDALGLSLLAFPALALTALALWEYFQGAFHSGEHTGLSAWNPPVWPFRLVFVIAFVLLTLQALAQTIRALALAFRLNRRT